MEQYRVCELTYQGSVLTDHWAQIDLTAVFSCKDQQVTVRGFYDGAGVYKVRFLPMAAGVWQYQVSGVITDAGTLEVLPAAPGADHSPVYAEGCQFRRRSGALFWPFGTTVYALAHQEDALVRQTLVPLGWTKEEPEGAQARERWQSLGALADLCEELVHADPELRIEGLLGQLRTRQQAKQPEQG